jgi:hypothetical protein
MAPYRIVLRRYNYGAFVHLSHRQLFSYHHRSDSVFMVPPFLAYYGALTENTALLNEAYHQIKLYSTEITSAILMPTTSGNISCWEPIRTTWGMTKAIGPRVYCLRFCCYGASLNNSTRKWMGGGRDASSHCHDEVLSLRQGIFESATRSSQLGE